MRRRRDFSASLDESIRGHFGAVAVALPVLVLAWLAPRWTILVYLIAVVAVLTPYVLVRRLRQRHE